MRSNYRGHQATSSAGTSGRALACLQDLQDLAIHHGLLEGVLRAPRKALDQLLPHAAGADPHERSQAMIERFNQLIPLVTGYLDAAGITTKVTLDHPGELLDESQDRPEPKQMDIVQQYFHSQLRVSVFEAGRALVAVLDQGIGHYSDAKDEAVRRMRSPISLLAWFVGVPLTVMERAGIESGNKIYGRFIQSVMGLILSLLVLILAVIAAQRLGLPLEKVLGILGR